MGLAPGRQVPFSRPGPSDIRAPAIHPMVLDRECEAIRAKVSVAFMVACALETQTRLARDLDPELHKLLGAAHGQALYIMCRHRAKLREARHAFRERERTEPTA